MVTVVYRVALVATLAALTALLVAVVPPAYAAPTPTAPQFSREGYPEPQNEDQAQNLKESIAKGCSPDNLFEDLSCKGPLYRGYESIASEAEEESSDSSSLTTDTVSQQSEVASTDCFVVDVSDTEQVRQQEVTALQLLGFYSVPGDGAEQLYSPQCADGELITSFPDATQETLRQSECFDVVGPTYEEATVEYIGCPEGDSIDDPSYRPITQQGTLAPPDWREHVTPVHKAKPVSLSIANPYVAKPKIHSYSDTGRSQGQTLRR